ncbi:3-oxosteroid 1-dehydrogenase [Mycena pura]|uniref:3-oxosteroid 1-dehydrogenase n=1 Tax=Mycena pura TaxID=153505 RepID=A0AAD6VUE6_9AGAR|nr:3-oxosteroid 1-dehydrogenase [Mycena pura]
MGANGPQLGRSLRLLACLSSNSMLARIGLIPTRRIGPTHPRPFATVANRDRRFDAETDVLIIGSGAAGLTAAIRAHHKGLQSLIIEKSAKVGGTSAYSGGALWIPANHVQARISGRPDWDHRDAALRFFDAAVGDVGPASSPARREAYVDVAPLMVKFLEDMGVRWMVSECPDYYPDLPGGRDEGGRTIEPERFDLRALGNWEKHLVRSPGPPMPAINSIEANRLTKMMSSWSMFAPSLRTMIMLGLKGLMGAKNISLGRSLVAQLLRLNLQANTEIWRESALDELLKTEDGTVIGAVVAQVGSTPKAVRARHGVLLCAGGFARNPALRQKWGPSPASTDWTSVAPGDMGDAITAGIDAGAATALLDDAWWGPTMVDPVTGLNSFTLYERARPFCIIVDEAGSRFMNEAEPYTDAGHHQYERNQTVKAIPAWMILDWNHRKRYTLGRLPFRKNSNEAISAGRLFKADTIPDLCKQIGVDADGLQTTIARFNAMCVTGVDTDFGRGGNAYDRFYGDHTVRPNPNLGPVEKPPFYAVRMYPGDLGTKGGLLTDEVARVLRRDGSVISGLYAAGNTSASVMGRTYLGAGATLGPAMTFAYIAVDNMALSSAL